VVGRTGKRSGVNVMAAISNKGELYFTCYSGSFTGPVFLAFLKRLTRHLDRKIHLIVDGHPVHRRVMVATRVTMMPNGMAERSASVQVNYGDGVLEPRNRRRNRRLRRAIVRCIPL
jgi:DDE superfamily endonuclease